MANNRYNFAVQPDGEGAPSNPQVPASTFGAQNVAAQTMVSEQSSELNVQGVHVQVRNVAVRKEVAAGQMNSAAFTGGAPKTDPQVTAGERGLVPHASQAPALPVSQKSAEQAEIPSQTTAPLAITSGERGLAPQTSQVDAPQNGGAQTVNLQRTGAASKQVTEVKLEEAHIQAGNVAAGAVRAVAMVEGERKVVHQAIEVTDDGDITLREYVRTERVFYRHVFEIFYIAALNEPEEPPEPSCKEKCVDCCCQSFSCNFSKMTQTFTRRRQEDDEPKSAIKKIDYMTPVLRRGRAKGWVVHTDIIFPLVKNAFRNVWVGGELLIVLIALGLSIASFSLGKNRIFNILHLALTILGSILAIIDGVILLYGCDLVKQCGAICKHDKEGSTDNESPGQQDPEATSSSGCRGKCKQCIDTTQSIFDIIRMFISELIFYPLLICDIFEVITGQAYLFSNVADGISFILFIVSLVLVLLFVYLVRIVIVVAANYHSQKKRGGEERSIRKSALYFQGYFIFHVIAQMVAHILMIIAIGTVIRSENDHLFNNSTSNSTSNGTSNSTSNGTMEMDESIHISGFLWYMLVAGYILPICGLLSFFIVTYFWVQEFPIGICVDVLSILKLPGIDETLELKATGKEAGEKVDKINRYIHVAELKKQFKGLRDTAWCSKFSYPFHSPQMVILCLTYAALQLVFVISGVIGAGMHWSSFFAFAIIVGIIANIYVFAVALVWSMIIVGILAIIAALILLLMCCCVFLVCLAPDNSNNRRR